MYDITQVFMGNGVIEVTSTNDVILKDLLVHLRNNVGVSVNKVEIKQISNKVYNVKLINLETAMYTTFWAILSFLGEQNWEPFATVHDTVSFRLYKDTTVDEVVLPPKVLSPEPEV